MIAAKRESFFVYNRDFGAICAKIRPATAPCNSLPDAA
jgi:hypothetical protein